MSIHQPASPSRLFRDLTSTWNHDASSERVDLLAAELASAVAAAGHSICVGLIQQEAVPKFYGLVFLLDSFGLVLRKRYRKAGDAVFVYVEAKQTTGSEFAGAYVYEVPARQSVGAAA
jgi:hypothetical protein